MTKQKKNASGTAAPFKICSAGTMASRQNPQHLEYPLGSSGLNLWEIKFDAFYDNILCQEKVTVS
jgi:hypothetical protein